ncbi:MAG: hypothetical protein K8H88_24205, partial [Sandaracinaceae bacterium]|nr:hypothetical protein [Sandaracinaceae bacterium]
LHPRIGELVPLIAHHERNQIGFVVTHAAPYREVLGAVADEVGGSSNYAESNAYAICEPASRDGYVAVRAGGGSP